MMIGSVGAGFNAAAYVAKAGQSQNKTTSPSDNLTANTPSDAEKKFMAYMKMSPMERMMENWLQAHKLSKEKLASMSPEEREKILKQMQEDIQKAAQGDSQQSGTLVDTLA